MARYNVSTDLVAHTKRSLEINEVAGLNAANICGVEGFADHIKPNGVAVDSSGGKASTVYRDRGSQLEVRGELCHIDLQAMQIGFFNKAGDLAIRLHNTRKHGGRIVRWS